MTARLISWLSPNVMHALGWALIHSLWQGLAVAALAAVAMGFSRRPSLRYGIAVGALTLVLVMPVATLAALLKPVIRGTQTPPAAATMPAVPSLTLDVPSATGKAAAAALQSVPHHLPLFSVLSPQIIPPAILPWLVGAWLCGVTLFSLRFAGGFLLLEHRRRRYAAAPASHILALCDELREKLGLSRAIQCLECAWLQTPAVIGWLRPVLLLPVTALTGLSQDQLRAVIAHELAHIKRMDAFVNLFQILVETLLFYHPAVWWLNRRIRAERELACDEIAVTLVGDPLAYARTLTLMAQWERAPALAMAANRGSLSDRVFHILGRDAAGTGQRMLGLTGSALLLVAALGAANALFGIVYPVPAAHAREAVKAVLASSQTAMDHAVHRLAPAGQLAPASDTTDAAPPKPAITSAAVQPEKILVRALDLSAAVSAPVIPAPALVASNGPPTTAPVSVPATDSAVTPCRNSSVFGRVISPTAVQLQGFTCFAGTSGDIVLGMCPLASTNSAHQHDCHWDVALNVQLTDPSEADKLVPGKVVRLSGDFHVTRQGQTGHVTVSNARVLFADYYWGPTAAIICRSSQLDTLSQSIGMNLCVQRDILDGAKGAALAEAARAPVTRMSAVTSANPEAISCTRADTSVSTATRASPPPVMNCAYNSYWIWAAARGRPGTIGGIAPFFQPQPPPQPATPSYPYIHF